MVTGTPKFYNDILDILNSKPTYTIVGNHDMYYRNDNSYNMTALDSLLKTGVQHLSDLSLDNIRLIGVDYEKDYPVLEDSNTYNIIVAHAFYEDFLFGGTGNANLTHDAIEKLGKYNAVVLGHDHSAYDILQLNNKYNTKIIRPGSLMRGTSHNSQVYRIPQVAVFDTETLEWEYKKITNVPGKEVFKEKVILEKDMDINIDDIINNMDSYDSSLGIYNILKENENKGREIYSNRYDSIILIIQQYLESFGVVKGV
jgi:hypothetical protein